MTHPSTENTAIFITAPGGPDVLQLRPISRPVATGDAVLIRVAAAGVNRHDCGQRRRGPVPAHSDIPGLEVAGTIVALGDAVGAASGWRVGDRVCTLTDGGGYATHALAPVGHLLPIPDGFDFDQAAALPEALFTVWFNFFELARLGPGESVLIHGGTSGVGTIAIQLLRALGHPAMATCGSEAKCRVARELGAAAAWNYRSDDFVAGARAATQGRGVDVILDMSGGCYNEQNLEALAHGGRIVHLSPGDGARFDAPLRLLMAKQAIVTGSMLRPLPADRKTAIARTLRARVWPLLGSRIRPLIARVRPLAEAAAAHAEMESGDLMGKLILATPGDHR
ncbi:MAG: NAD(P)H-quinone oxidoreductase [Burkholderiaceae bacterium]